MGYEREALLSLGRYTLENITDEKVTCVDLDGLKNYYFCSWSHQFRFKSLIFFITMTKPESQCTVTCAITISMFESKRIIN